MAKTVLIYDELGQSPISFLVVDGDHSDLDGVYINMWSSDKENYGALQDKLLDLTFDKNVVGEYEYLKHGFVSKFPREAVLDGAIVVTCGFIP